MDRRLLIRPVPVRLLRQLAAPPPEGEVVLRGSEQPLRTNGKKDSAAYFRVLADDAYRVGEFDSANAMYQMGLGAASAQGDSAAIAVILTSLGNTARWLGDYSLARRYGEDALALKTRLDLSQHLFDSYNALGLLAREQDRLQDARELFTTALQTAETAHDTVRAKVTNNLGLVLQDFGEFPEARRLFQEASDLGRIHGNARIEGRSLNNLAVLENEVGRPRVAHELLTRAGPLLTADPVGESNRLGQLGTVAAAMGEAGQAIGWLDSALRRARALELPQEVASNLEQLADLHWLGGDTRRALDLLTQAQRLNRELGRTVYQGIDLRREAEFSAELGDVAGARAKAAEALIAHRAAGARLEELADLLLLADLASRAGLDAGARAHLGTARQVANRLDAPTARTGYALTAARVALAAGRHREALRVLETASNDLSLAGTEVIWQAELIRSRALAGAGDLQAAAEAGRRALASIERVRGSFGSGRLRTSYQSRRAEVYEHFVLLLLRLGRSEEALEVADAGRGRSLLEHLAAAPSGEAAGGSGVGGRPLAPTVRELAEEERKLLARIDSVSLRIKALGDQADHVDPTELKIEGERLARELERTRQAYEDELIRTEERLGSRRALMGGAARAGAIRAALRPGEALLEYLVTAEKVILFVVRTDTVVSRTVDLDRMKLRAKVRVARALTSRAVSANPAALTDLFEILIEPVLGVGALGQARRLFIVPHAELQYLPFAALRNPKSGRYLVEDFTLVHLPSAASLPTLRANAPERSEPARGVAFAPLPDQLPGTIRETDAFRKAVGHSRVVRGGRATETALRQALRRDAVVHVASHGVLTVQNPMFSRIEMARGEGGPDDDGRFEVHEVLGLSAASRLVFLSGCETGTGVAGNTLLEAGEDYATLARSFLYAGVRNVVATLWRIEDEGAAAFAAEFYRALASRPPAEALAEAQRRMIAQGRYRAAFYWAAYRLDGGG